MQSLQTEQFIPAALKKLRTSADDAAKSFEECKDKDLRKYVFEWCQYGVSILTENLTNSEKLTIIANLRREIENIDKEP